MNNDTFQGKWKELKGEIQTTWAKLTNDELEETKGNIKSIGGLIQQKYGSAKEEVSSKLDALVNRFSSTTAEKSGDVKDSLKKN